MVLTLKRASRPSRVSAFVTLKTPALLMSRLQADLSLSSVGGSTEFGRESAVKFLAETIGEVFDIPMSVPVLATDISFGLPEAAGQCLSRKVADKQTIEDMTVAMMLSCIGTIKDGYDLKLKPLSKRTLTNK